MRLLARLLPLVAAGHLTLTGCEPLPPTGTAPMPVSISLNTPDESFRLGPAERENIGRCTTPMRWNISSDGCSRTTGWKFWRTSK